MPPANTRKRNFRNQKQSRNVKTANKVSCKLCEEIFASKKSFNNHKKQCKTKFFAVSLSNKSESYKCQECNKRFRFLKSIEKHMMMEHSNTPDSVQCADCIVKCPDKDILSEHIKKSHEHKDIACEHCGKQFARQYHVKRHMKQKGCGGNIVVFPCQACSAKFSRKDNLIAHFRQNHIQNNSHFACKFSPCTYTTVNYNKYIKHYMELHRDGPKHFECDHCGGTTTSKPAMIKHMEIHGEKSFCCNVCGYKTFTVEVLRRHMLTHVKEKPHPCPICHKSYIQRMQLERHLLKHAGYKCPVCGVRFNTRKKLNTHKREECKARGNYGSGPFRCEFDGCPLQESEFADRNALMQHSRLVHGDKHNVCEICSNIFNSQEALVKHMNKHVLERPRRCMYCVNARAYARGVSLVYHVRQRHRNIFMSHLAYVRQATGKSDDCIRISKDETEAILKVLDEETNQIVNSYGEGVIYGGVQEVVDVPESNEPSTKLTSEVIDDEEEKVLGCVNAEESDITVLKKTRKIKDDPENQIKVETDSKPLLGEAVLALNLRKLLEHLVDKTTLECLGWPRETVDAMLVKLIEMCGATPADKTEQSRFSCLRENTKKLFVHVIEDKNISRMLKTHSVDQIVNDILSNVADNHVLDI